jgi:ppGpp synthetase/RelA/SpoT-type nucleotidyltranferase
LQSLHLTTEKNLQTTIAKSEEEMKSLKDENELLESYREKSEELQLQLELMQEEMKDLAQVTPPRLDSHSPPADSHSAN